MRPGRCIRLFILGLTMDNLTDDERAFVDDLLDEAAGETESGTDVVWASSISTGRAVELAAQVAAAIRALKSDAAT